MYSVAKSFKVADKTLNVFHMLTRISLKEVPFEQLT